MKRKHLSLVRQNKLKLVTAELNEFEQFLKRNAPAHAELLPTHKELNELIEVADSTDFNVNYKYNQKGEF